MGIWVDGVTAGSFVGDVWRARSACSKTICSSALVALWAITITDVFTALRPPIHQRGARQQRPQDALSSDAGQGGSELVGQLLRRDKPSGSAHLDVLGSDANRQHRLAQAGWSDQRQRPRLLDERWVQVAQHHLAFELGTEAEVELLDGGRIRKAGLTQPLLSGGVGPCDAFLLEQAVQEVGIRQLLARGTVEPIWQHRRRLAQAQLLQQRFERGRLRSGDHRCSSALSTNAGSWSCCTSSAQT